MQYQVRLCSRWAPRQIVSRWLAVMWLLSLPAFAAAQGKQTTPKLEWIQIADDGVSFRAGTQPFVVWGVNYDHDRTGRLLEDYWLSEWETVVEDFREIAELGANVVRIHLQLGKFMTSAEQVNRQQLAALHRLVVLAEQNGLYLDLTGLGCYHKPDVPAWYDALSETERWDVQARFWGAIAETCQASSAIFCYDLMNEPIVAGKEGETDWLAGAFGDKYFVQRIALELNGRKREEIAAAWVQRLVQAIRRVDQRHLITVGVIPWAHVFPKAKPLFYTPATADALDFVSVHFYPKQDQVGEALTALRVYELGKPLVVEEIFPLKSSLEETNQFIDQAPSSVAGWISFYWGETIEECRAADDLAHHITAAWLTNFAARSAAMKAGSGEQPATAR